MIQRIATLAGALLISAGLHAQVSTRVTGTVNDAHGEPVIGAVVMLENVTSVSAITDLDGKYTLTIPEKDAAKAQLSVSCLGYSTQTAALNGKEIMNFTLDEDLENLDEAVVVGYGSVRRSDLTGSVTSVKINEADAAGSRSVDRLLQGHAAGVQVTSSNGSPDGSINIRVRGVTSLNGSNEPLYVIDGIIMTTASNHTLLSKGSDNSSSDEAVNSLLGLNPQDIASIEILKDASATAIYGSAGANGVVLITTKAALSDKPTIKFTTGIDISKIYKKMDLLDFNGYVDYLKALVDTPFGSSSTGYSANEVLEGLYEDPETRTGLMFEPIDWQDYLTRTAVGQRHYFSVSGRPSTLSYKFSLGYINNDGIMKDCSADQYTVRLNVDKTIGKKFKIGTKINYAHVNSLSGQSLSASSNAHSSVIKSMTMSRPIVKDYSEDDNVTEGLSATPARWLSDYISRREEFRVTPSVYVEYNALPWLTLKSSFGADYRMTERSKFKAHTINHSAEGTTAAISDDRKLNWNNDNLVMVNKSFGNHSLSGTVGMTISSNNSRYSTIEDWNMPQYTTLYETINAAPNASFVYNESLSTMVSYFVRGIYNYHDRYVLTSTYRIDGSSKFVGSNKFSSFPSFAFAWRINREPWFNIKNISSAKLRIGWGRVGNSAISAYQTMASYSSSTYGDHTSSNPAEYVRGLNPSSGSIPNPSLKWETTEQSNIGFDFGMWKGRFSFTVDAYNKYTYDLLQAVNVPISSGFKTSWVNRGSIRNKGLEMSTDITPVRTNNFEWNLTGNISFNRNTIESLGINSEGTEIYLSPDEKKTLIYKLGDTVGATNYVKSTANIFIEGYPIGLFYGHKTDGIVQKGETGPSLDQTGATLGPGSIKYVDVNGDGYISDDDRTIIGDPNPDFTFGFGTSMSYKNFTFSMDFNGSYGNDIVNANLASEYFTGNAHYNIRRAALVNAWTENNPNNYFPGLNAQSSDEITLFTDRLVEDGSYLRFSNVRLTYDVPLKKGSFLKGLNIGMSVNNVFIFTKYSGWDPDVNSFGSSMTRIGIDVGSYPTARTYSFDIGFTF